MLPTIPSEGSGLQPNVPPQRLDWCSTFEGQFTSCSKRLVGEVEQKGYTLVPINLHWKDGRGKCDIALAKGKAERAMKCGHR